ncbi:unnamed protein product [Zymoseptoria tritici ST99CH_1A5]|uniref:Uncharacterized protein n=1 Tax=Zymoseptoria tritici ST99CH_1A5 TaxID=1276529 RepID=A0A1Y6LXC9_ZYMTR|nr:unnamed protein product [Zymoseptoria tritici ST99CH_1A5]
MILIYDTHGDHERRTGLTPVVVKTCSSSRQLHPSYQYDPAEWPSSRQSARKQISAHCLPQDHKELIEFMHAVGWNVSDSDLFGVLATKLLSWMFRSVTNKAISPSIVKKKIDPDQKVMANWQSKWSTTPSTGSAPTPNSSSARHLPSLPRAPRRSLGDSPSFRGRKVASTILAVHSRVGSQNTETQKAPASSFVPAVEEYPWNTPSRLSFGGRVG